MWQLAQALVAIDYSGCIIKWAESTAEDIDGYNVYMSTDPSGGFERMNKDRLIEPMWVSPQLRTDTKYFFYVTAIDTSDNESTPSAVVPFLLHDAVEDTTVIYIPDPLTIDLFDGTEYITSIDKYGADFCMRLELGEII